MIEDYIVQKSLGQGSYGTVKLARHQQTLQKVAIKIASRDEIQKEYELLSSLNHPHIIQVRKHVQNIPREFRTKNNYEQAIIMDYVEGGDLIDLLARHKGKLPEKLALKFLCQLLSAVGYLHKRGIVHRDIKPDNLLMDETCEKLILADFGLAEFCDPTKLVAGSTGSLMYCAPELLRGSSHSGSKMDIWSVGVVFYCMLTGCIPWSGDNVHDQMKNALKGRYYQMPCLSEECDQLIASMLTVNPKYRPTADQLLQHVVQLLARSPPTALKISMHRTRTD